MNFISKISEKTRSVLLLFFGPLFFLSNIGLLYLNKIDPLYDLWALFFLSIVSISLFHKKGLYLSLGLALVLAIVHYDNFAFGPIWMAFWNLSLFSSLWTIFLGQNELEKKFEFFHSEQIKMKENFSIYEAEMEKEMNEQKNELLLSEENISKQEDENYQIKQKYQSAQTLVDILRKEETQNFDERQSLINECIELRRKTASFEEKMRAFELEKNAKAKNPTEMGSQTETLEEIEKITKAYEELLEENRSLKEKHLPKPSEDNKKYDSEIKKYQDLYSQLQRQFEEQKIHIHEARKELFHTQEKLNALEKEKEMNSIDLNEKDKTVEKMLIDYMMAVQNHEEEIENLEKIITTLNQKTKPLHTTKN